jgi:hypothetical protein
MIDKVVARNIVAREIERIQQGMRRYSDGLELAIIDDHTIERDFGWVFFYVDKRFIQTGNPRYMLFGNAPIIVNRNDGSLHTTGTAKPIEEYIQEFEKTWVPNPK